MNILVNVKENEEVCSFSLAGAFYLCCKDLSLDVETVANMMLLEARNEQKRSDNNAE